ncbi:MAG: LptA/OstA family protein [Gammaproteobacteria bacterium]
MSFSYSVNAEYKGKNIIINSGIVSIEKNQNKVFFENGISIKSDEFKIEADKATYDNLSKITTVFGNPATIKSLTEDNLYTGSADLITFTETNRVKLIGNAFIKFDDVNVSSKEIIFNAKDGKILSDK